jgi:DNA-binding MarR family transcriptional regulator
MPKSTVNPFPVTGYAGPEYFCDREQETKTLLDALTGGRNVTLISLRRMGKTALIHHLFRQLNARKNILTIYADIMPTAGFKEFTEQLATSLARACPDTSAFGKKVWSWIKSVKPQITFDGYSGLPQITFELSRTGDQQATVQQLFALLQASGKQIIIALDEFQQITQYPETQTEAWLRTETQNLKSVNFIFSGSQQHLLSEMFSSAKRPFYASAQMSVLSKLDIDTYVQFISSKMKSNARVIAEEDIGYMLTWCRVHTYYVQALCSRLFTSGEKILRRETIDHQIEMILKEQEAVFFTFRELLTGPQWSLLRAIAKEGVVYAPMAMDFISKHGLGTPATIKRSLDSLSDREMIYKAFDKNGKGFVQVYDVFLSRWLERQP